ncbi:MAG: GrpB family protein [Candidatus Pacebacteria bacterium]|nr:GrpB family protein [Candidatus Paceibacterota bacterium]
MANDLNLIPNNYKESKKLFENEKERLQKILHNFEIIIEHIGSTSIKGSIGKGIIDIIVACDNKEDQEKIKYLLSKNGYRQGELNKKPDGRLFFCNVEGQTKAGDIHLHLVIKDSDNYHEVINFRNYLHNHPDEVEWYNDKKKHVANITNNSRKEYVVQKGEFVRELINRAKKNEPFKVGSGL